MANTKYSKATGGTPIISWIPNQMKAVMKEMRDIIDIIDNYNLKDNSLELKLFKRIKMSLNKKEKLLEDQLEIVNKKIFSSDEVFELNKKYDLSDINIDIIAMSTVSKFLVTLFHLKYCPCIVI